MNEILRRTHKRSNIDLLRARDYWFDKARRLSYVSIALGFLPASILLLSYLPPFVGLFLKWDRDVVVGILSVVSFIIDRYLNTIIDKNRAVSNEFREQFDVDVLGIPKNQFILINHFEEPEQTAQMYRTGVEKQQDHIKAEYWYEEIFSDNHFANVIVAQLDNALYTRRVYLVHRAFYIALAALILISMIVAPALSPNISFVLVAIAEFDLLATTFGYIDQLNTQIDSLNHIRDIVENADLSLDDEDKCKVFVRELQDSIASYRNDSVFISKTLRESFLKEDSAYYSDLNKVKAKLFSGRVVTRPETDDEIEVFDSDGSISGTLSDVHDILRAMLNDVIPVLERAGVRYTLDGGSLIGAMRPYEDGSFMFWDDDIDIALDIRDVSKAIDALKESLGSSYDIQSFDNDPAYSPRLANFRIRHKGTTVGEKDSMLFGAYRFRGVFIDVYAYGPTLGAVAIDRAVRRVLIHPLNKRLRRAEIACYEIAERMRLEGSSDVRHIWSKVQSSSQWARYLRLKERMLKRIAWYELHAKNESVLAYTPNYIYNPKKAGPYISEVALWGGATLPSDLPVASLEGVNCRIPQDHDAVLRAYYGDWTTRPFRTIEEMRATVDEQAGETEEDGCWYSRFVQGVTGLKHLSTVSFEKNSHFTR